MKWFRKYCRRREKANLLAADALRGDEKIATQRHLAQCADCRTYYDNLRELAAPLAEWEKDFLPIVATETMQTRWAKAVQQTTATFSDVSLSASRASGFLRQVWRELISPSRYAWSGLAMLWVAMLLINRQLAEPARDAGSPSPQALLQAWKERSMAFAEWDRPVVPAAPDHLPPPRSQREEDWFRI
jgi:hypothetical protein